MPRQEPGEPYQRINLDEAFTLHDQNDGVVIDVRRPDEYEAGHVKGAISIPVDDMFSRVEELPKDTKLLFICAQGVRSGLACEMVAAMGLGSDNLYNIEDGTPAWIDKGLPTSYGSDR